MEWILDNWSLIILILFVADKVVAATPNPYDDIIVTAIKRGLGVFKKGVK